MISARMGMRIKEPRARSQVAREGDGRLAGIPRQFSVTGLGGVPASAKGVVLSATVTEGTGAGYVTVWPSDATRPTASSLNFIPGQTVANLVLVKVPASSFVNLYNAAGQVHLILDVVGLLRVVAHGWQTHFTERKRKSSHKLRGTWLA